MEEKRKIIEKGFLLASMIPILLISGSLKASSQKRTDLVFKFKGKFEISRKRGKTR